MAVRSENIFSAALSSPSASVTLASTPLRRLALSCASRRMVSSSSAMRASASCASAASFCSRSRSAVNCVSRMSSSASRSRARCSSRSRSAIATLSRFKAAPARASASRRSGRAACASRLTFRGLGLRTGALGDGALADVLGVLGVAYFDAGRAPAQVIEGCLVLAHLRRYGAITHRLARLFLQALHLRGKLADHVFQPQQVRFRRLQPQLGLVPARMQAGDAGGFFQHAAALLGLGLDDLADAALVHQCGRACAGGGVGEQNLHVAGAHLAAVDAIGGAGLALDAARDVDRFLVVEGGRRRAVAVVDRNPDFGVVARRPGVVAGEDDVVHRRGAHGFIGGFPHDPAQRFDEIGFAATVRAHHAGQSRLDQEVGGLHERLKPEQAQPCELHISGLIPAGWQRPSRRVLK